jgi:hypothetical protein
MPPERASVLLLFPTQPATFPPSHFSHLLQLVVKYLAQQPGDGVLTPMGNKLTPR